MAQLHQCDKCGHTYPQGSKEKWVKGNINSTYWLDDKESDGFIHHFDLCPKCAQPLLKFSQQFFNNKSQN